MANSTRDLKRAPSHPGKLLSEIVLPATGKSKVEIASLRGISRQTLYDILSEKAPVTPEMAVRFGKLFGNGPNVWAGMQNAYDLWHCRTEHRRGRHPDVDNGVNCASLRPS